MTRSLRPINAASTLNAWNGVVRVGFSPSKDCGFSAPNLGLGYQPEHIQEQAYSGRKGR
jgi:hypothetical protein